MRHTWRRREVYAGVWWGKEAKGDFLEDGMDEWLVLQIRKQGVPFQHVCSAVVLISFLCILATICSPKQI